MDFIGVGFPEVVVILLIAILAVGPRRLPELARKMGQMANKFRMTTTELTRSITAEIEEDKNELRSQHKGIKSTLEDIASEIKDKDNQ